MLCEIKQSCFPNNNDVIDTFYVVQHDFMIKMKGHVPLGTYCFPIFFLFSRQPQECALRWRRPKPYHDRSHYLRAGVGFLTDHVSNSK